MSEAAIAPRFSIVILTFARDAIVLDTLHQDLGSVSRLPGSWKDF